MPGDLRPTRAACPEAFPARALRTDPDERRLVEAMAERVLALHPAWPWPLVEEEARRRAEAMLSAGRRRGHHG
jgi:hypothetical protein